MKIRKINGNIEDISEENIIAMLLNGIKFYLIADDGTEVLVSAEIQKSSLSDISLWVVL